MTDSANQFKSMHASTSPVHRLLMKRFYRSIDRLFLHVAGHGPRVADIGCGEGFIIRHLQKRYPNLQFAALDLNPRRIRLTKRLSPDVWAILGNVHRIPIADDVFDVVLANEILEHLTDPHRALTEIARVARGYVICSSPNEPFFSIGNLVRGSYWRRLGRTPAHLNFWSRGAFARLIAQHLEVHQVESCLPRTFVLSEVRR